MTTDVALVASRFAAYELAIRRLFVSDPEFRGLCEDYATARSALERWEADDAKARDYRQLVEELEEEISMVLEQEGVKSRG